MFTKFDKTFAALISGFITAAALHFFGIELSPGVGEMITTVVASAFAWLIPNKTA